MSPATLHYIYDPLCGWCYASAPLILAARQIESLTIEMHAGGLWTGRQVQKINTHLREHIIANDERIEKLSGQTFGQNYFNGLLKDSTAVLDSEPPIRAILVAEQKFGRGLDFLKAVQNAHYVNGLRVSDDDTLLFIAQQVGLDAAAFAQFYADTDASQHIAQTQQLMAQSSAQGYPSMLLQHNGALQRINHGSFYGQPDGFALALQNLLQG